LLPYWASATKRKSEYCQICRKRSQSVGAVTLLAQAARYEWEEARASRLPQVSLGGMLSQVGSKTDGLPLEQGPKGTISINVTAPLFDSGRLSQLAAWRSQLAESARHGLINAEDVIGQPVDQKHQEAVRTLGVIRTKTGVNTSQILQKIGMLPMVIGDVVWFQTHLDHHAFLFAEVKLGVGRKLCKHPLHLLRRDFSRLSDQRAELID
jgi:hypothetical protein